MWFFKRKEEKIMTNEMREKSLETRRLQHQIAQLEKQVEMKAQLTTLQEMMNGSGNGSKGEEAMLMMLMQMFMQPQKNHDNPAVAGNSPPTMSSPQNTAIARFLADKIPENVVGQLQNTTDADIIDIKNKVLMIKAGGA
jgi:hypothetical protein